MSSSAPLFASGDPLASSMQVRLRFLLSLCWVAKYYRRGGASLVFGRLVVLEGDVVGFVSAFEYFTGENPNE